MAKRRIVLEQKIHVLTREKEQQSKKFSELAKKLEKSDRKLQKHLNKDPNAYVIGVLIVIVFVIDLLWLQPFYLPLYLYLSLSNLYLSPSLTLPRFLTHSHSSHNNNRDTQKHKAEIERLREQLKLQKKKTAALSKQLENQPKSKTCILVWLCWGLQAHKRELQRKYNFHWVTRRNNKRIFSQML